MLKDHNAVMPSRVKHSTTEPLHSHDVFLQRVHDISSKALSSNATFRRIRHHVERDHSSNFCRKTTRRMDICRNFVEIRRNLVEKCDNAKLKMC